MLRSGNRPRPGNDGNKPGEESGLLSPRALTMMALSIALAVLAGLSAGFTAGINVAHSVGPGWGLAVGLAAGLAAAAGAGLTAAVALDALGTKREGLATFSWHPRRNTILGLSATVRRRAGAAWAPRLSGLGTRHRP